MKITRKHVISIFGMILFALIMSLSFIGISPLWLTILMIRPSLLTPLSNLIMKHMTQVMMGMMFSRPKQERTQPIEVPE
jgi:uncharacterized protein (DUF983 family)